MQKHIFRSTDIRGVVGVDFLIEEVYMLTQSMMIWFSKKSPHVRRVAVALDGRVHGHEIYQKVAQAIVDAGYQVYFLGVCPTPVFVYGLYQLPVQAGIMITGSGSSAEFNGFKLYLDKNLVQGEQLHELYALHLQRMILFSHHPSSENFLVPGKTVPCPILEQYVDMIWQEFAHLSEYDFSIMIDCAHGSTGPVMKKLVQRMGWKLSETMHDVIDGNFPVHNPEPFNQQNLALLQAQVQQHKKSFGIVFDGDGDRMLAVLPNGTILLGDSFLAIFARDILSKYAHRSIVFDMQRMDYLSEIIAQSHGKPIVVQRGLSFISTALQSEQTIFAAQMHGRYFFKDRHAGYADGMYAMFRLLEILVKRRCSLDDLLTQVFENMQYNFIKVNDASNNVIKNYL